DSLQIRDHRLQRKVGHVSLRMPGPAPVVVHQGEPLRQLLEDPVQKRVLPFHPQIAERNPRNENHRGAIAGDRESHAHTIRAARITYPRSGSHRPTLSSGHEHDQNTSTALPRWPTARAGACTLPACYWTLATAPDTRRSPASVPI